MNCRLCQETSVPYLSRDDVALHRCVGCGFVSGKPSQVVEAEQRYERYYDKAVPTPPSLRYHQWLARAESIVDRGKVLEVGAGTGGFVRAALARGWSVNATELSKSALSQLRATGASVFEGDVAAARYPNEHFDFVVSVEVIEHLASPLAHLAELRRVTRDGGLLLLTTPNFDGLSRRYLGARWRVIDPEHLCYFTTTTLTAALRQTGYRNVQTRSRSLDILYWRRGTGQNGVRFFDPQASARLRDAVHGSTILHLCKSVADLMLGLTGFGDTLLAWAQR